MFSIVSAWGQQFGRDVFSAKNAWVQKTGENRKHFSSSSAWEQQFGRDVFSAKNAWVQKTGENRKQFSSSTAWEQQLGQDNYSLDLVWKQFTALEREPFQYSWLQNEGSYFIAEFEAPALNMALGAAFPYIDNVLYEPVPPAALEYDTSGFSVLFFHNVPSESLKFDANQFGIRTAAYVPSSELKINPINSYVAYNDGKVIENLGGIPFEMVNSPAFGFFEIAKFAAVYLGFDLGDFLVTRKDYVPSLELIFHQKLAGIYLNNTFIETVGPVDFEIGATQDFEMVPFARLPSSELIINPEIPKTGLTAGVPPSYLLCGQNMTAEIIDITQSAKSKAKRIYILRLRPAQDGYSVSVWGIRNISIPPENPETPDIELPCTSITITNTLGSPSSVLATVKNASIYSEQAASALNGWMMVDAGYLFPDNSRMVQQIAKGFFAKLDTDYSPGDNSMTLTGNMWIVNIGDVRYLLGSQFGVESTGGMADGVSAGLPVPESLMLEYYLSRMRNTTIGFINYEPYKNVTIRSARSRKITDGLSEYTCDVDLNIRVGDIVTIAGHTFESGSITYNLTPGGAFMTIRESEFPIATRARMPVYFPTS